LSPNPIQNYLDFNSNEPITEINIFNLEGQKVANYQLDRIQKGRIDISNKPVGMYIIELKSPEKSSRTKMMIE
jgi:phage-related protein